MHVQFLIDFVKTLQHFLFTLQMHYVSVLSICCDTLQESASTDIWKKQGSLFCIRVYLDRFCVLSHISCIINIFVPVKLWGPFCEQLLCIVFVFLGNKIYFIDHVLGACLDAQLATHDCTALYTPQKLCQEPGSFPLFCTMDPGTLFCSRLDSLRWFRNCWVELASLNCTHWSDPSFTRYKYLCLF